MTESGGIQILQYCFQMTVSRQSDPVSLTREYYWWKLRRNIVLALRRYAGTPGLVVDVGAGHGVTSALVYRCLGPEFRYLATDLNDSDLEITRAVFRASDIPGSVQVADASVGLPVADGDASIVVCTEVLEHIPDPPTLLREIHRILRPHGFAVFTTPNPSNPLVNLVGKKDGPFDSPDKKECPGAGFGHVSVLTRSQWREHFRATGFESVKVRRGALLFGKSSYEQSPLVVGLYILLDALLDWLPGLTLFSENLCYIVHKSGNEKS